ARSWLGAVDRVRPCRDRDSCDPAGTGEDGSEAGDVHEGRRADPAEALPELSSPWVYRTHVADDLRRGPSVGAVDEAESVAPRHAAVVHRPHDGHPEVQERRVA